MKKIWLTGIALAAGLSLSPAAFAQVRLAIAGPITGSSAAFGAQYEVRTADDGEVEVSHSADLYVVDDAGDIVLQWPFGTSSADIAADLSTLLGATTA